MTAPLDPIARTYDDTLVRSGDRETQREESSPRAQMEATDTSTWAAKIERGEITEYDRANVPPRWVR